MSTGNAQPVSISSSSSSGQQITIFLNPANQQTSNDHIHQSNDHHQLTPPKIGTTGGDTYQIASMQPVSSADLHPQAHFIHVTNHNTITTANSAAIVAEATNINAPMNANSTSAATSDQNHTNSQERDQYDHNSPSATRFKWTEEKSQVAMNLVKYGCKPKLISVAVGCSLRTAQKFAETVTPKIEGESFKTYQIKRRGRKSKDVNQRLNAIREVLSRDSNRTQVEIAADLKVSNTTVCRDLKRLGASWKSKKNGNASLNSTGSTLENSSANEQSAIKSQASSTPTQQTTTRKTRQSNSKSHNNTIDVKDPSIKTRRQQKRNSKTNDNASLNNNSISNPDSGQTNLTTSSNNDNVQQ